MLELLKEAMMAKAAISKGFLIDGYPRELEQGLRFEKEVSLFASRVRLLTMSVCVECCVLELLKEAVVTKAASSKSFLVDGYPRELEQGLRFEKELSPLAAG